MVLYIYCMYQCGLYAMVWLHIGILMRIFDAEPRSTAKPLFSSQCLCGTVLLALYSMMCMVGILSIDWYCGDGVFRMIAWLSVTLKMRLGI